MGDEIMTNGDWFGHSKFVRADIAAAREADLRAERDAALARERALLDSNDANRQARLDANAAHQRQVDSMRAEVERLTQERDEARGRFNDLDLCHMGVAPCQTLISAHDEAARLRGLLDEAREGLKGWLNIAAHCNITDGSCCCGEDMRNHSPAMDCGHVAVDHGGYVTDQQIRATEATLAKIGGQ